MLALNGIGIGNGIASGRALVLSKASNTIPYYLIDDTSVNNEVARLNRAVESVKENLRHIKKNLPIESPPETSAFIDVHLLMLKDPLISEQPAESISTQNFNAEWALKSHSETLIDFFQSIEDPYLRQKKDDVKQVVREILKALSDEKKSMEPNVDSLNPLLSDTIIVAHDLSPADTIMLHNRNMCAFITNLGGPISHTAILAKSLEIPAIVGLHGSLKSIKDNDQIIVDASSGTVLVDPTETLVKEFEEIFFQRQKQKHNQFINDDSDTVTLDGEKINVLANIELPNDLDSLNKIKFSGVGLYRTEFLFMNREEMPTESEQYEAYCHVLNTIEGPVTIRTLDLGTDKQIHSDTPENTTFTTPALGLRAIRLCLAEPSIFKPQLRAIFRAAVYGDAQIMLPMLCNLNELEQSLAIIKEVCGELEQSGTPFNSSIPIGGMIEVPAAAISAHIFAKNLDFLSIGTNDLIQYTLAIDRIDDNVNYLYDPLHPSVLQLIYNVIVAGKEFGIPISMCGEMAGDPEFTKLLLGLGLRNFSMEPTQIHEVRQEIRESTISLLENKAYDILHCNDPSSLYFLVEQLNSPKES